MNRPASTAGDAPPAPNPALRRALWLVTAVLAGAVLALIFVAYLQPGFLLEVLNLRYCG